LTQNRNEFENKNFLIILDSTVDRRAEVFSVRLRNLALLILPLVGYKRKPND